MHTTFTAFRVVQGTPTGVLRSQSLHISTFHTAIASMFSASAGRLSAFGTPLRAKLGLLIGKALRELLITGAGGEERTEAAGLKVVAAREEGDEDDGQPSLGSRTGNEDRDHRDPWRQPGPSLVGVPPHNMP